MLSWINSGQTCLFNLVSPSELPLKLSDDLLNCPFNVLYTDLIIYNTLKSEYENNKARYTATLVACGWAGAVLEKVTRASGQELYAQKAQKRRKSKKGTDRPTDQPTDIAGCRRKMKRKNGTDQPTNQPTDRLTDIAGCRVA